MGRLAGEEVGWRVSGRAGWRAGGRVGGRVGGWLWVGGWGWVGERVGSSVASTTSGWFSGLHHPKQQGQIDGGFRLAPPPP